MKVRCNSEMCTGRYGLTVNGQFVDHPREERVHKLALPKTAKFLICFIHVGYRMGGYRI